MKIYEINPKSNFETIAKHIGASVAGVNIMREKSQIKFIFLKGIKAAAANILKQDALSIGADLVSAKDTILGGEGRFDALLMATDAQLKELAKKEKLQDFGLKKLSEFLSLNQAKPKRPCIMGVVNINDDSFNAQSRAKSLDDAMLKIETMIESGAEYIDVGAVSSRPGSEYVGADEELRRLSPLLLEIKNSGVYSKVKFSLDSFEKTCIKFALDSGFVMINDITADSSLAPIAASYNAELCIMHMKGTPKDMQINPHYDDIIGQISEFLSLKKQIANEAGVKNVVLDVGIGFGKSAKDNILLIKHLSHFSRLGAPLLVGASRKSVINAFYPSEVKDRLAGSLFLHLMAAQNGASIIRTHDVAEHAQLFALNDAYDNINLW